MRNTNILETLRMIEEQKLDIRTVTMGISLLDCADSDGEDNLHGVLLVVWGCVPNEEAHKGTGIRIFIRAIIGYPEHTV